MHTVYLGIVKSFMKIWFSKKNCKEPYSLYSKLDVINQRISRVKYPHSEESRLPKEISDNLKKWKAHEFKLFLFCFSAIMKGLLPQIYIDHFELLITAMRILSRRMNNTSQLVIRANHYITHFISRGINLYGEKIATIKLHSLLHITTCVLDYGPLCEFSAFRPEHFNGVLSRQIHGTRNFEKQVIQRFTTYTVFHNMLQAVRDAFGKPIISDSFLGMIFTKCGALKNDSKESKMWKIAANPYNNVLFKNKIEKLYMENCTMSMKSQIQKICADAGLSTLPPIIYKFEKIKINGRSFFTQNYDSKRKSSCFLSYLYDEKIYIGKVNFFLYIQEVNKLLANITRVAIYKNGVNTYKVENVLAYDLIDVLNIKDQMVTYENYVSEYFGDFYQVDECTEPNCCDNSQEYDDEQLEFLQGTY